MFKNFKIMILVFFLGLLFLPQLAIGESVQFKGKGILMRDEWGTNTTTLEDFEATFKANINFFEIVWRFDFSITGAGINKSYEINLSKNPWAIKSDESGDFVYIEYGECWGGGCEPDESKPGEVGHINLNILINLMDLRGYINANGSNTNEPWWVYMGNIEVEYQY